MFVVLVHYTKGIEAIDAHLEAHRAFLDKGYAAGMLLASGPRIPRTGGIILAKAASLEELKAFLKNDPFNQAGIAKYEFLEFEPVKCDPRIKNIIQ